MTGKDEVGFGGSCERYIERDAALAELGVKPQTLYAYVSRGLIRSVQRPGGGRQSLYAREDVAKLKARSSARAGHAAAASSAMRWGEPIIPTAITDIRLDGPHYRGRPALGLVRAGWSFESVAELLWSGPPADERLRWKPQPLSPAIRQLAIRVAGTQNHDHIIETLTLFTLRLGMARGTLKSRLAKASPFDAGRQLIQVYAECLGLLGPARVLVPMEDGLHVAEAVLRALGGPTSTTACEAIDALLILLADHELTSSTFAARVAASAGATLHGCATAALATASGGEIGRLYDRVEEFLKSVTDPDVLYAAAHAVQLKGQTPPGFNHPMYPRGDPRAELLFKLAVGLAGSRARGVSSLVSFCDRARQKMHLHPRVELGVVALCRALRLPRGSPSALFLIARTAGTVAHVIEQRSAGFLLRPRARFVGANT